MLIISLYHIRLCGQEYAILNKLSKIATLLTIPILKNKKFCPVYSLDVNATLNL